QSCNAARVLGRLTLAIVEVGRDRDHGFADLFTEIVFRGLPHLLKNEGGNLGRAVLLVTNFYPGRCVLVLHDLVRQNFDRLLNFSIVETTAHQALDREYRIGRIGYRLPAGNLADEAFIGIGKRDDRWGGAAAFGVGDYNRIAPLHHRYAAIG